MTCDRYTSNKKRRYIYASPYFFFFLIILIFERDFMFPTSVRVLYGNFNVFIYLFLSHCVFDDDSVTLHTYLSYLYTWMKQIETRINENNKKEKKRHQHWIYTKNEYFFIRFYFIFGYVYGYCCMYVNDLCKCAQKRKVEKKIY